MSENHDYTLGYKMLGNRVALTEIDSEVSGSIIIPQTANTGTYELGTVREVGEDVTYVNPGQNILFQMPQKVKLSSTYNITGTVDDVEDGQPVKKVVNTRLCIIHQDDILAILKGTKISLEDFEIGGNWILLSMWTNAYTSVIAMPESYAPPIEDFRFTVLQLGRGVTDVPYSAGDEVFIERQRANPIKIDDKEYVFIDKSYVYGWTEKTLIVRLDDAPAPAQGGLIITP